MNIEEFIEKIFSDNSFSEKLFSDVAFEDVEFNCLESERKSFEKLLNWQDCRKRDYAIGRILNSLLDNKREVILYYLTDDVLTVMINKRIEIMSLAHSPIDSKWLLKIYRIDQRCVEALQTVALRILFDDSIDSIETFFDFINNYKNKFVYFYMFYKAFGVDSLSENMFNKLMLLCHYIQNNFYKKDKLFILSRKYKKIITDIYTKKEIVSKSFLDKQLNYGIKYFTL